MPEPVVRAHTHGSDLRTQKRERLRRGRPRASVMPHLEQRDVSHCTLASERIENLALGVTGQQGGERTRAREDHDARIVLGGIRHDRLRPDDVGSKRPDRARVARERLGHRGELTRDVEGAARPRERSRGHDHLAYRHHPLERTQASRMVLVQVRERHELQPANAVAPERGAQGGRIGPGVYKRRPGAILQQDRVTLPHVEHHQPDAARRRRPGHQHDQRQACERGRGARHHA